jgi:hypothetical protein
MKSHNLCQYHTNAVRCPKQDVKSRNLVLVPFGGIVFKPDTRYQTKKSSQYIKGGVGSMDFGLRHTKFRNVSETNVVRLFSILKKKLKKLLTKFQY